MCSSLIQLQMSSFSAWFHPGQIPDEPVVRSPPIEPPFASPVGSSAAAGFRIDPARLGET